MLDSKGMVPHQGCCQEAQGCLSVFLRQYWKDPGCGAFCTYSNDETMSDNVSCYAHVLGLPRVIDKRKKPSVESHPASEVDLCSAVPSSSKPFCYLEISVEMVEGNSGVSGPASHSQQNCPHIRSGQPRFCLDESWKPKWCTSSTSLVACTRAAWPSWKRSFSKCPARASEPSTSFATGQKKKCIFL